MSSRRALLLAAAGFAAATALAAASRGFYHDDDVWHFLFALDGGERIAPLLDAWGRPGYTVPAALAVRLGGLFAARLLAAAMTAGTAWCAWLLARRVARGTAGERLAWIAPALVWLQPVPAQVSFTTLTETAAALWLAAGLALLLSGRRFAAASVLSLVFVTRYELLALGPLFGIAILAPEPKRLRSWAAAAVLLWAPAAYLLANAVLDLPPECSPIALATKPATDEYGTGGWLHFAALFVLVSGAGVLALASVGALRLLRRAWLLTAVAAGTVLLHTVLYRYGLFASGGYARFLVPVAGPVGALAAAGAGFLGRRTTGTLVGAAVLQAVLLVRPYTLADGPVEPDRARIVRPLAPAAYVEDSALARAVAAAEETNPPRVLASHGFVRVLVPAAVVAAGEEAAHRFDESPAGSVFIWESGYGGEPLRADLLRHGDEIARFGKGTWRAAVVLRR